MARRPISLKYELWLKDPRCHWCKQPTILHVHKDGTRTPENAATIDHVYPVNHPKRIEYKRLGKPSPVVLACRKCNGERGCQDPDQTYRLLSLARRAIVIKRLEDSGQRLRVKRNRQHKPKLG